MDQGNTETNTTPQVPSVPVVEESKTPAVENNQLAAEASTIAAPIVEPQQVQSTDILGAVGQTAFSAPIDQSTPPAEATVEPVSPAGKVDSVGVAEGVVPAESIADVGVAPDVSASSGPVDKGPVALSFGGVPEAANTSQGDQFGAAAVPGITEKLVEPVLPAAEPGNASPSFGGPAGLMGGAESAQSPLNNPVAEPAPVAPPVVLSAPVEVPAVPIMPAGPDVNVVMPPQAVMPQQERRPGVLGNIIRNLLGRKK